MTEDTITVIPASGLAALMRALRPHLGGETPEARAAHERAVHRAIVLWHWGRVLPHLVGELRDLGHVLPVIVVDEARFSATDWQEERRRVDEVEGADLGAVQEAVSNPALDVAEDGLDAAYRLIALADGIQDGAGQHQEAAISLLAPRLLDFFGRELDALGRGQGPEDGQPPLGAEQSVDLPARPVGHVAGSIADDASSGPSAVEQDGEGA